MVSVIVSVTMTVTRAATKAVTITRTVSRTISVMVSAISWAATSALAVAQTLPPAPVPEPTSNSAGGAGAVTAPVTASGGSVVGRDIQAVSGGPGASGGGAATGASAAASTPTKGGGWLGLASGSGARGAAPPWPDAPYTYFAAEARLTAVLSEFATNFSLALDLAPGLAGTVNGRFSASNPGEFLTRLGSVYGFAWYVDGGTLHVGRSADQQVRALPLPAGLGPVRQMLQELGVVDPRFGWTEIPSQKLVLVSGPPGYVTRVESALRQMPTVSTAQQVNVYRLRYASADDRVIQQGERRLVQPGLAGVLRSLMLGGGALAGAPQAGGEAGGSAAPSGLAPLPSVPVLPSVPQAGEPKSSSDAPDARGTAGSARPADSAAAFASRPPGVPLASPASTPTSSLQVGGDAQVRAPSIQTDPRLNAVIIQDMPERMALYERLIAQLDVPTPLIEIEALIIDINSERVRELGINWAISGDNFALGYGATSAQPGQGTFGFSLAGGASTLSAAAGSRLLAQVRLLETQGDARIQSRPSVLTLDNLGALLDLSETFYIRVMGERFGSVSPVTAGTSLRVTPRLIEGELAAIQMAIDIEDGQIQDRQIDTLPTVRRSTVSTQAIVRHTESLLIAGYSTDQAINAVQKVPLLGNLPVVGPLFSTRSVTSQKRERLFLIRPRLVGLGMAPPSAVPGAVFAPTPAPNAVPNAAPNAGPNAAASPSLNSAPNAVPSAASAGAAGASSSRAPVRGPNR